MDDVETGTGWISVAYPAASTMAAMSMGCPLLDPLPHRSYGDGSAHVVELDITDGIRGPSGAVHGGLVASLVDRAGA
ncbi:MAG TPA: hypothetical protein VHW93_12370, partial [Acidimicrobiales bacterium]|nr:hypothetical protein [Acidimicrobiales bacterium]